MRLSSFRYALRDAFRSLWRNKFMSIASMATVAISLIVLGGAWLLVLNTHHLATAMESELEINIYLHEGLTPEQSSELKTQFESLPGVATITFVSKEEGLKNLEERFAEDTNLVEALGGNNPLPDMYRLKAQEATQVPEIAKKAEQIQGVETVRYGQGMVEKLLQLTNWLRSVGLVIIFAVGMAAVFLIATTIRLTVFARRREITIMKLVGATNWYIRWPFFLEGMLIGFTGAFIAVASLYFFYSQLSQNIAMTVSFVSILSDQAQLWVIFKYILFIGTFLGAVGSAISLHRFLRI